MNLADENPTRIIAKKRDGHALRPEEIAFFVAGFQNGSIPDYQMAALAMAVFLRGMDVDETACLTHEMLHSGRILEWPSADGIQVDKHSTGGIGDKVSLILAPVMAVCGFHVPMISGRGLGPTGGTLDKLESIPGFRTDLSLEEMQAISHSVGCVIASASAELAPADRKLYALRDVTGTVPSIPLITASIMSKKLAEGLDALVLDVKCGSGAFMKTPEQARELARSLVRTGEAMGVRVSAMLTDMNQPLGRMVGNAVEVDESKEVLQGGGPDDLRSLTVALCGELLRLTGQADSRDEGEIQAGRILDSGQAWEKFCEMVVAQGGSPEAPRQVAPASPVLATQSGHVSQMDAEQLGFAVIEMGGGRKVKSDRLDFGVGFEMLVRLGDSVESGQPLANLFSRQGQTERVGNMIRSAITISDTPAPCPALFIE